MSKAILVIEMPKNCLECPLGKNMSIAIETCIQCSLGKCAIDAETETIPGWCTLKPIPNKKQEKQYCSNGVFGINTAMETRFNQGYNACIDEILGGSEE